jgi:hypothetical protein
MRTIALTKFATMEVISAYCAPMTARDASADDHWTVVGSFFIPAEIDAQLEVVGVVSEDGVTLKSRLYDVTDVAAVAGSDVEITTTVPTRATSTPVLLQPGHVYQIQMTVVGDAGQAVMYAGAMV